MTPVDPALTCAHCGGPKLRRKREYPRRFLERQTCSPECAHALAGKRSQDTLRAKRDRVNAATPPEMCRKCGRVKQRRADEGLKDYRERRRCDDCILEARIGRPRKTADDDDETSPAVELPDVDLAPASLRAQRALLSQAELRLCSEAVRRWYALHRGRRAA